MSDVRQRTFWKRIQSALFSPASILLIAAAVVLIGLGINVPMVNAPPIAWLVGLAPLWMVIVVARVMHRRPGEKADVKGLPDQNDVNRITNPHLRTVVTQAVAYRERIKRAAAQMASMRLRLQDLENEVAAWVEHIDTLARRLDVCYSQQGNAPLLVGVQTPVSGELKLVLDRAEFQLESALAALGTLYSQVLLLDARNLDSAKAQRLRDSVASQMVALRDIESSLDEVYQASGSEYKTASNESPVV